VPGGAGVFEGLMVIFLRADIDSSALVPALIVYRLVYYLVPLSVALIGLMVDELHVHRDRTARVAARVGRLTEQVTPRVLAALTFGGGLLLLFSGATPAAEGRLALLDRVVPLGVIETSHFIGSVAGAGLLLLSQGLARRLDAAHALAVAAVSVGIAASLLKGGDYEEALLLGALLAALVRARPAFQRHAAFFATRFSPAWVAAVAGAIAASVWLGFFAFRHVEYGHDLWWQFALDAEASRFLRGSVGAAALTLVFAVARLLRPAPHAIEAPTDADLAAAAAIIAGQPAHLPQPGVPPRQGVAVQRGAATAFLMYAVQGRSWVAMGDPVGPPERVPDLIRLFLERCDDFGGTPVFYEIDPEHLHHYADFGLTFVKLGEEARVDLSRFALDGSEGAKHRQLMRRLEKDGGTFRIVPPEDVPGVLDQLETVSSDWLDAKAGAEKGFSLGSFDRDYIARFPVAVVEHAGRIVAFGNLWTGGGPPRAVDRSDALSPQRAAQRHGGAARPRAGVGQGPGLSVVRARHGADVRLRILADRPALGPRGRFPLHARRRALPVPRAARLQGEVPPRMEAPLPRVPRRPEAAAHPGRRRRARRRRISRIFRK
jgi:phosphatidylglycerol lysyltransferase